MSNLLPYRKNFQPDRALPGELIYMYRSRLGLTQARLAELLGLKSGRMILNWEGGLSLPTAAKLKVLLEVLLRREAFVKGQELIEALHLWQTIKDYHDASNSNYLLFPQPDKLWLEALIKELAVPQKTAESSHTGVTTHSDNSHPVLPPSRLLFGGTPKPKFNSHNLPNPITELIGREKMLAKTVTLVQKPRVRLLTITGPGGIGKTRLALEVARELLPQFSGGIYFVELAGITSPDPVFLLSAIANVLGIAQTEGEKRLKLEESLNAFLSNRESLLVLDNFEHLLPAGPALIKLLQLSPGLKLFVTSRETLHLYGEYELPLLPLEVPLQPEKHTLQELAENAAVKLFMERAEAAAPDFSLTPENVQTIAKICACLDGLPLALELIAARIKLYPPQSLLERLINANSGRLSLLDGGPINVEERQQTLRNSLMWSYSLLTQAEKKQFAALGVFRGGFSLAAVQAICEETPCEGFLNTEDLVLSLVQKNLVRIANFRFPPDYKNEAGQSANREKDRFGLRQTRFEMLETIREFAAEQLAGRGEEDELNTRHARFYLELAIEADLKFSDPEQVEWVRQFEADTNNLQAAINWSIQQPDPQISELGLQIAVALGRYWRAKGFLSEGRQIFEKTLAKNPGAPANLKAKAFNWVGVLVLDQGNYHYCLELFEKSLAICRENSIKPGMAAMLNALGLVAAQYLGNYEWAEKLFEESLALMTELGNSIGSANTLNNMGIVAQYRGQLDEAISLYEKSLAIHRETGNKRDYAATLNNLGEVKHLQGLNEEALLLYTQALEIFLELDDPLNIAVCLKGLAFVAARRGRNCEAAQLLGAAENLRGSVGGVLPRLELADYEQRLALLSQKLGKESFFEAWEAGRTARLKEVLQKVLPAALKIKGKWQL